MMGAQVEFHGDPANADWLIGENSRTPGTPGDALRYMHDPNLGNQPDTYQGANWAPTTGWDNGGVHTNSGVANFQFYLLSDGGSGVNDNGDSYSVSGIGITKTSLIWYRAQTNYLTVSAQYADARSGAVNAATDLYGAGSNEVTQVENAWEAVGVGVGSAVTTVGHTIAFGQITNAASRRAMPFAMPETGTIASVTMYHSAGSGNMILGIYDSDGSAPNNLLASTPVTAVSGTTGWQTINLNNSVTVAGGTQIWLAWVYETNPGIYYQGGVPGRADAGVGWSGDMPTSFGASTLGNFIYSIYAEYTVGGGNQSPVANANGPYTGTVNTAVSFSSAGSNDPDGTIASYLWDFGDGATSSNANPSHTYTADGAFNVSLTVTDDNGATASDNTTATISTAGGTWVTLTYDDFESGWGSFVDGGSDCRRNNKDAAYAHQGAYCARIRDNTNTSKFSYSSAIDVTSYSQIKIEFWYYPRGMETNEDFWVQYYDGSSWQTVASYAAGVEFTNKNYYEVNDIIIDAGSYNFPANMKVRFVCDASNNKDWVYIDEVRVSAMSGGSVAPLANDLTKSGANFSSENQIPEQFSLRPNYPNPFNPSTNIQFSLPAAESVDLLIYNRIGQLVRRLLHDRHHAAGSYTYQWNGRDESGRSVASGLYFIKSEPAPILLCKKPC